MKSLSVLIAALALGAATAAAPQTPKPAGPKPSAAKATKSAPKSDELPPLSYTCTMHPDQLEDKPGTCPVPNCGMKLVPIRLESVWTCAATPLAAGTIKTAPGQCPIDHTPLIQVVASVSWNCPGSDVKALTPGSCADGTPRKKTYEARAHGNHNPQHGGSFFMAPDAWHHLEGALPQDGVFRVYLYDDFTKPLKPALFNAVKGRVVTEQSFDPATKKTTEIKSFPLVPNAGGTYFEAKIGKTALPASMTARMKFTAEGKEFPFDFTFASLTKDAPGTATPTNASAAPTTAAPKTTSVAPKNAAATPTKAPVTKPPTVVAPPQPQPEPTPPLANGIDGMVVDPSLIPPPITGTVPELLAQLKTQTEMIRGLIDKGSFGSIYVPAFQAKDIALALDEHRKEIPADRQRIAEPAVKKLIRAAWLLDAFGDIGNKQQIVDAYATMLEASKDIQSAFPDHP